MTFHAATPIPSRSWFSYLYCALLARKQATHVSPLSSPSMDSVNNGPSVRHHGRFSPSFARVNRLQLFLQQTKVIETFKKQKEAPSPTERGKTCKYNVQRIASQSLIGLFLLTEIFSNSPESKESGHTRRVNATYPNTALSHNSYSVQFLRHSLRKRFFFSPLLYPPQNILIVPLL